MPRGKKINPLCSKYQQVNIRMNITQLELIKCKALENHVTCSDVIRDACQEYLDKRYENTEIIHQSLMDVKKKIQYADNKLELLGLIALSIVREMKKNLPDKQVVSDGILQEKMKEFEKNCIQNLLRQHPGKLEQMVLDTFERSVQIDD